MSTRISSIKIKSYVWGRNNNNDKSSQRVGKEIVINIETWILHRGHPSYGNLENKNLTQSVNDLKITSEIR